MLLKTCQIIVIIMYICFTLIYMLAGEWDQVLYFVLLTALAAFLTVVTW